LASGELFMPVRLPVGATLQEVTVPYVNLEARPLALSVRRLDVGAGYKVVGNKSLVGGAGVQTATIAFTSGHTRCPCSPS